MSFDDVAFCNVIFPIDGCGWLGYELNPQLGVEEPERKYVIIVITIIMFKFLAICLMLMVTMDLPLCKSAFGKVTFLFTWCVMSHLRKPIVT